MHTYAHLYIYIYILYVCLRVEEAGYERMNETFEFWRLAETEMKFEVASQALESSESAAAACRDAMPKKRGGVAFGRHLVKQQQQQHQQWQQR